MDLDWCLSCGRHIKPDSAYCSQQCRYSDGPSSPHTLYYIDESASESPSESDDDHDVVYHTIEDVSSNCTTSRWAGNGPEGIAAWAKEIPSGPPELSTHNVTLPHCLPSPKLFNPPKLLLPYRRPVPPTLCMSSPQPTRIQPSVPITTPQQQFTSPSLPRSISEDCGSMTTSGTESIATPSSLAILHPLASDNDLPAKPCMLGNIANVCSWVSPSSHRPTVSPAPTHKPLPSQHRKRTDSASFTVLAKTHSTSALRRIPPSDETDDSSSDDDGIWWLSGRSGTHDEKLTSKFKSQSTKIRVTGESGRRPAAGLCIDHPAYRSRGRKLSRNIS